MPEIKELRYFAYDEENAYHNRASAYYVKSFGEYLSHFNHCSTEKAIGEASPNYLRSTGAAERIKSKLPDVKIIVSLRNPADRLYSLYMMHYRKNDINIPFDEQAFRHNASWIKSYFCWNELKHYFNIFDRNKIKVIIFDDLKGQTLGVIAGIYKFLNVDHTFIPDIETHNKGGMPKNKSLYTMLSIIERPFKTIASPPPTLKNMWQKIKRKNLEDVKLDPLIRKKVLEVCEDDIYRTQALIDRDLTIWLK